MNIYFSDQQKQFSNHLKELKKQKIIPYERSFLKHKINHQLIECRFSKLSLGCFFNYKIFPENILNSYPQWIEENRAMAIGDTIVQQINIPPTKKIAQRIIAGVRIKEIFNSESCIGFSYETLEGHVEKGISVFKIEASEEKSVFTIETYSANAIALLKIFQPLSSFYQDYCTSKALKNMKNIFQA